MDRSDQHTFTLVILSDWGTGKPPTVRLQLGMALWEYKGRWMLACRIINPTPGILNQFN